jgi:Asp-tRNA(Asn)/Glu-tRNA(Gln) amidotransferase A subunit family amidase
MIQNVCVRPINPGFSGEGVLSGLTFTVKANIDVAGVPNGQGNPLSNDPTQKPGLR